MTIFGLISPNFPPKTNFLGENDYSILYIFGPTFSAILENLLEPFSRNVPKTAILAKNGHFLHFRPNLGKMRIFLKKKGSAIFTLIVSQLHAKFLKILGAVSKINCVTYGRSHARTDKGDIIEPVASLVQKIIRNYLIV